MKNEQTKIVTPWAPVGAKINLLNIFILTTDVLDPPWAPAGGVGEQPDGEEHRGEHLDWAAKLKHEERLTVQVA